MRIKNSRYQTEKNVKNLKRTSYKEPDKKGKLRNNLYVEYTVIGNNGTWRDFMPIEEFKRLNPKIDI